MSVAEQVLMVLCVVLTLFIVIDFINTAVYIVRHYNTSSDVKSISLEIVGVYPAVAVSSLISLFVPRSSLVCELMAAIFVSHCMVQFTHLMTHYYGGKHQQLQLIGDKTFTIQVPPCCCCCCCLPKPIATKRNLQILQAGVLQGFVLQPFIILIILVLWLDGDYTPGSTSFSDGFIYLTVVQTMSTIMALYAFIILFRMCSAHLKQTRLRVINKFFSIQFVIIFTKLQEVIWIELSLFGVPSDRGSLSGDLLASTYDQILTIIEMFILTLVSRRAYRHPHEITADMISIEAGCAHDTSKEDKSVPEDWPTSNGNGKHSCEPCSEKSYSSIE